MLDENFMKLIDTEIEKAKPYVPGTMASKGIEGLSDIRFLVYEIIKLSAD